MTKAQLEARVAELVAALERIRDYTDRVVDARAIARKALGE